MVTACLPPEAAEWDTQQTLEYLYENDHIYIPRDGKGQPKYKQYVSSGVPYQDIWAYQPYTQQCLFGTDEGIDEDVKWVEHGHEKLGFPTQKPQGLLERIIRSSCPKDGVVLDPFCGCGTTISAAQELNRRWVGIDITFLAVSLIKNRLRDSFGDDARYRIIGEPTDLAGAKALAEQDKMQFQWWSLGLVEARPQEQKKGADRGIDGRILFHDDADHAATKQIIISVKGGNVSVSDVRDLRGVIERESAAIGVLITLRKPTRPMRTEATGAGFYVSPWDRKQRPRLQILTIEELINGAQIEMPPRVDIRTFKRAPKAKRKGKSKQSPLGFSE